MSLGALSQSTDGLTEEENRISNIASGVTEGFVGPYITEDDLDDIGELYQYVGEKKESDNEQLDYCLASYNRACIRDVQYSLYGRVQLRINSLNTRNLALYGRAKLVSLKE